MKTRAYYDYAPSGCGDPRCNNGWYYWNGTEYPCGKCADRAKKRAEARKAKEDAEADAAAEAAREDALYEQGVLPF